MNEQELIDRLLKDAKKEARDIVAAAKTQAAGNVAYAKKAAGENEIQAKESVNTSVTKKQQLANIALQIDKQKSYLAEKNKIVTKLFDDIRTKLLKSENAKLISALSKSYAKPGDKIKKENGGIIVSNANYEIRLTIDDLLEDLREELEADVARILFA